jgi:hypothetical protein
VFFEVKLFKNIIPRFQDQIKHVLAPSTSSVTLKEKKVRMHEQYLLSTLRNSVDTCEANTIIYDTERASTNIVTTTRSFTALPFPSICQPPISVFLRKKEMERLKTGEKKK